MSETPEGWAYHAGMARVRTFSPTQRAIYTMSFSRHNAKPSSEFAYFGIVTFMGQPNVMVQGSGTLGFFAARSMVCSNGAAAIFPVESATW